MRIAMLVGVIIAATMTVAVGETLAQSDFDISTLPWVQDYREAMEEAREAQDKAFEAQEHADKVLDRAQELMIQSKMKTDRFLKNRRNVLSGFRPSDKTIKGMKSNTVEQTLDMYKYAYRNAQPYVVASKQFANDGVAAGKVVVKTVVVPMAKVVGKRLDEVIDYATPAASAAYDKSSEKAKEGLSWIRNKTGL